MTPSDSSDQKIGGGAKHKQSAIIIFLRGPSYSQFSLKIRCHGNRGRQEKNLSDTIG